MGVSAETVATQLHLMASAFRRKISPEQVAVYHAVLDRHVRDEREFVAACEFVLENETNFPPVALLLKLSREYSRQKAEIGIPWVRDSRKQLLSTLREWLDDLDSGRPVSAGGRWASEDERRTYEQAVRENERRPGEGSIEYARRLACIATESVLPKDPPRSMP